MDRLSLVEKLREKTNISYEEAKNALENNNWDILDALVYLEERGRVKKPKVSEYYTNESKESYKNQDQLINVESQEHDHNYQHKNNFNGFFEAVCRVIDTGNNIFLEIKRHGGLLMRIPITVVVLLLFFTFWIIIPLMVVGLFFEIEFSVAAKMMDTAKVNKINEVFNELAKHAQEIRRKIEIHISS